MSQITLLYLTLVEAHLLISIILLIGSVMVWPKVIPLSGIIHCPKLLILSTFDSLFSQISTAHTWWDFIKWLYFISCKYVSSLLNQSFTDWVTCQFIKFCRQLFDSLFSQISFVQMFHFVVYWVRQQSNKLVILSFSESS